jgi:S-methylmethionine-dependent homocysteine/selenocysteine methylase
MTYPEEAAGIVAAANRVGLPSVIGFTTETDGRLPAGQALEEAIEQVDRDTDGGPAYYMVNCAHTDHFSGALAEGEDWTSRIGGIRANASRLSHAELDEMEVLDDGDPREFGELHQALAKRLPWLCVFGGCCGTDHRHIEALRPAIL